MSADITSVLNRHRFQLDNGSFPDAELQRDWTSLGADGFDVETVDLLESLSYQVFCPLICRKIIAGAATPAANGRTVLVLQPVLVLQLPPC